MAARALSILAFLACWLAAGAGNAAECGGSRTRLEIQRMDVPPVLRHDQPIGRSRLVLRDAASGKTVFSGDFEGHWFCIGFNKTAHRYVLGGVFERGAWLPLSAIGYLREDGGAVEPSAFTRQDYLAMASQADENNRYIAFIGGNLVVDGLYVMDVEKDTVRKLGAAPAPPPLPADSIEICRGERFGWGECGADGYKALDEGVVRFRPGNVLEVSYGRDNARTRAKKRHVRRFELEE